MIKSIVFLLWLIAWMPNASAGEAVTESDLAKAVAAMPPSQGNSGVVFQREIDGFTANGAHFVDPEGRVNGFVYDGSTGNVTYLTEINSSGYSDATTGRKFAVKFVRASSKQPQPIKIATATEFLDPHGKWRVETASGITLSGNDFMLTSHGFLILRQATAYGHNTGFLYSVGEGVRDIVSPEGYHISANQFKGNDIASTGNILLKADNSIKPRGNDALSFLSAVKGVGDFIVGDVAGGKGNEDYALLDFNSGKIVNLEMSVDNSNARVRWIKAASGVYAVYQTHGMMDVYAVSLASGVQKKLFHRALGIGGFSAEIADNGKLVATAYMPTSKEIIDDLEAFMAAELDQEKGLIREE